MKIALIGKMRSGKDTLAKGLTILLPESYAIKSMGNGVREVCMAMYPFGEKKGKNRDMLQFVGQKMREYDEDVWVNIVIDTISYYGLENVIVTDVRQLNEYEALKKEGFVFIKLESSDRNRMDRIKEAGDIFEPEQFFHETELSVDRLPYDYFIENNGSREEFANKLMNLVKELRNK